MTDKKQLPLGLVDPASDRGRIEARVVRQEQVGESLLTCEAAINLPVDASATEMERAAQQAQVLVRLTWGATTDAMVGVVLGQIGKPTLAMLRTLLQFTHRLNLTPPDLQRDAAALGITLGEQGVLGLTFDEASLLLDTLAYRVDQLKAEAEGRDIPPTATAPVPAGRAAAAPPVTITADAITLANVNEVPIETLLQLRVHWTKQHRGQTIEDLLHGYGLDKVRWFAGIGEEDEDRWIPKEHPSTHKIDPKDRILQAACARVYQWAVEQQTAEERK